MLANIMKNPTADVERNARFPNTPARRRHRCRPCPPHEEDRQQDREREAPPRGRRLKAVHLPLGHAEEREPGPERERARLVLSKRRIATIKPVRSASDYRLAGRERTGVRPREQNQRQ